VFKSHHYKWQILGTGTLDGAHCVRETRNSVCKEKRKRIRGCHDYPDVNAANRKFVPKMSDVNDQQIASSGELNLDSQTEIHTIDSTTLGPIHATRGSVFPPLSLLEPLVQELSDRRSTVSVPTFLHAQVKPGENLLQL
jgi:hypothetical protein